MQNTAYINCMYGVPDLAELVQECNEFMNHNSTCTNINTREHELVDMLLLLDLTDM